MVKKNIYANMCQSLVRQNIDLVEQLSVHS